MKKLTKEQAERLEEKQITVKDKTVRKAISERLSKINKPVNK